MQGKLPCNECPYGMRCDECPELKERAKSQTIENREKGGFYSRNIIRTITPDGKEKYEYSNPE